jgi:uncharacterized protein YyaL (SSP411 family)
MDEETLVNIIDNSRRKLMVVREKRIRPHLDDKVLTDWNGMMIAALAKAARAFNNKEYLELAKNATGFLLDKMMLEDGRMLHRYRDGEGAIQGFLDDYSYLSWGLLELYFSTFDTDYLLESERLMKTLLEFFWDDEQGGFYFTDVQAEELLSRQMDAYDGAIPSGNSIGMFNLIRLGRMLGNPEYEEKASRIGSRFSGLVESSMGGFSMLLSALDFAIGPTQEVVIAGNPDRKDTREMMSLINEHFLPNTTVMLRGTDTQQQVLSDIASYTRYHTMIKEQATAHVCVEQNCKLPTSEVSKLAELLEL